MKKMKKLLVFLTIMFLIGGGFISSVFANSAENTSAVATKAPLVGDLNSDGNINISDMMVIRRHILGVNKLTGSDLLNADLNGDGTVNVSDMMVIRRHILGVRKIDQTTMTYTVHRILSSGEFSASVYSSNDFNSANSYMKELAKTEKNIVVRSTLSTSPMKIVAADRARVQSYPYRTGVIGATAPSATLNIYSDPALKNATTYIAAHYQMAYYGTQVSSNNSLVLDIQMNGARGFVDVYKTDIIPLFYIENGIKITLGGSEDYYSTPEKPDVIVVKPDTYQVTDKTYNGVNVKELSLTINRTYSTLNPATIAYAIAPNWLPVGTYYSTDGIHFFTDLELKNPVNNGAAFYAYYQWLPVRSMSNVTADTLNAYITGLGYTSANSVMVNNGQVFVENGNKYGMNALLIYAQASLESAYGSSKYARERYNLFGWNAVDSNPDLASSFAGVEVAVSDFMSDHLQGYFLIDNWRNFGLSFGNKGSGVSVKYASDPYYGTKVASIAYRIDVSGGSKDYDAYSLAKIADNTSVEVKSQDNASSSTWYKTLNPRINQIITNLGESNGFIKSNLTQPIKNGAITKEEIPVNLLTEFGFFNRQSLELLTKASGFTNSIPTERITVDGQNRNYVTRESVQMRTSWTDNSASIAQIPANTTVRSTGIASNGWVRILYNGRIGYVNGSLLGDVPRVEEQTQQSQPVENTDQPQQTEATEAAESNGAAE